MKVQSKGEGCGLGLCVLISTGRLREINIFLMSAHNRVFMVLSFAEGFKGDTWKSYINL